MHACKYLNLRVKRIGERNGESYKDFSKTKKKKNTCRMSFITQFKIEVLRLLTVCRKVLGKIPARSGCSALHRVNPNKKNSIPLLLSNVT